MGNFFFPEWFTWTWWLHWALIITAYVSLSVATSAFCGYMKGRIVPSQITRDRSPYDSGKATFELTTRQNSLVDAWERFGFFCWAWPFEWLGGLIFVIFKLGFYDTYHRAHEYVAANSRAVSERQRDAKLLAEYHALDDKAVASDTGGEALTGEEALRMSTLMDVLNIERKTALPPKKEHPVAPDDISYPVPMRPAKRRMSEY